MPKRKPDDTKVIPFPAKSEVKDYNLVWDKNWNGKIVEFPGCRIIEVTEVHGEGIR